MEAIRSVLFLWLDHRQDGQSHRQIHLPHNPSLKLQEADQKRIDRLWQVNQVRLRAILARLQ